MKEMAVFMLVTVIVLLALIAFMKDTILTLIVRSVSTDPEMIVRLIAGRINLLPLFPDNTTLYFTLPPGNCTLRVGKTMIVFEKDGEAAYRQVIRHHCLQLLPAEIKCGRHEKMIKATYYGGQVAVYEDEMPAVRRICT